MGNFEINIDPPDRSGGVVEIRGGGHRSGVIAIVAGLVIVAVLAVAVGRSRDKSVAVPPTTTTVDAPTTTAAATTTTVARSTTAAPSTTTTVAPVQVYGPLLPEKTGTTLVLVQSGGQLMRVDIDSGTVTNLAPGQRLRNVYQVVVLRRGVVVTGDNGPRLVADGAVSTIGFLDQLMGTADGVRVVAVAYTSAETDVFSVVPGGPRDTAVKIPAQSDPVSLLAGAIVLQSRAGGVYQLELSSGQVRKVADGVFVAAEGNRIASMTCDDALQCRIGMGPLGGRPAHSVAIVPNGFGYIAPGGALSPTRDLLAIQTSVQGKLTVVVLDLDTGKTILNSRLSTSRSQGVSPFVWSADGRWLFWADLGQVKAWSPDRGGEPMNLANDQAGSAELITSGSSP